MPWDPLYLKGRSLQGGTSRGREVAVYENFMNFGRKATDTASVGKHASVTIRNGGNGIPAESGS